MLKIGTWMAGQAKFYALYEEPFWRRAGLSGSPGGVVQMHPAGDRLARNAIDHTDDQLPASPAHAPIDDNHQQRQARQPDTWADGVIDPRISGDRRAPHGSPAHAMRDIESSIHCSRDPQ